MTDAVALLDGLLPESVRWAQTTLPEPNLDGDDTEYAATLENDLYPEEKEHIAQAVAKRRAEFAAVRRCARKALRELGYPPGPILSGEQREPLWPDGVLGSMTHCDGYCAAAVARVGEVGALGIDAEVHAALPEGVLPLISLDSERTRLAQLSADGPADVHWDRVLFSAKESVYKAWFPLMGRWLGFEEADIDLRADGTFTVRLLPEGNGVPGGFAGRWVATGGLAATAVTEVVG